MTLISGAKASRCPVEPDRSSLVPRQRAGVSVSEWASRLDSDIPLAEPCPVPLHGSAFFLREAQYVAALEEAYGQAEASPSTDPACRLALR